MFFYRPDDGVAADFIPFFWNGAYHLFYLKDYRDPEGHGEGTPWFHLETRDFVRFTDHGEALPRGTRDAQDRWVFTGSAIEREGLFHIFYTGHNSHFQGSGRPVEAVMHAVSPDLRAWEKDAGFALRAPAGYEADDWRDPFVFWNAEAGEYWMLLAARRGNGPSRHRGCTALAASPDLHAWEVREPFWSPDLYYTHECPDLFRLGDWWYLVYSTFSERCVTHYRMSRSLQGPWLAPANDTFDGRAYYAAKTAGDERERFVFGWLPTRAGESDDGGWEWGGNLVVHQLVQRADGTLTVRVPESVLAPFQSAQPLAPRPILGSCRAEGERLVLPAESCFTALSLAELPEEALFTATVDFQPGTAGCGLLLRAENGLDGCYQVRLEPANQRMVVDRWPRPGDQPFLLERSLPLAPGKPVNLRVLVDGTCLVIYADNVALSCRMYAHRGGGLGLFAAEGEARFSNLSLRTRS